ncbi:hypothetical protein [Alkalibacillus almallahensis]|uniref:hypothetical protein n=1 Tax=Alkalibacillus almallahensis TaxID=1379154 RepID=UPI001422DB7F|nr:hypothetical protein [Alkalibacillus almallahensis]NIK10916.1 hypothetical protein [Alkalibacillus almallahensis]
MAQAIREFIISFFKAFFTKWVEDFLIFVGLGIFVVNTYLITVVEINMLIGNYLLGLILLLIGLVLAKR